MSIFKIRCVLRADELAGRAPFDSHNRRENGLSLSFVDDFVWSIYQNKLRIHKPQTKTKKKNKNISRWTRDSDERKLSHMLLMVKHPANIHPPCTLDSKIAATGPEQPVPSSEDLLPRDPCLQALAALRHAKWFQVCFQI